MTQRSVGIINYGMGNIQSVRNALEFLGIDVRTVDRVEDMKDCSHLILPGVGAFPQAMRKLKELGFIPIIKAHIAHAKPFLGICLGMQLLADMGEELEITQGLGVIPGCVKRLDVPLHIPHVGWNTVAFRGEHPVFKGIRKNVDFYFVHSYCFKPLKLEHELGTTDYGVSFPSVVTNGRSAVAVQFHPEKSQNNGIQILDNFCSWDGTWTC
jgi:glutamine amidotransferase